MTEGTKGLRAVKLWDTWARALASGGDLSAFLAESVPTPKITAARPPNRVRLAIRHGASPSGQLGLELRVDYPGAPKAELELDGVVRRENGLFETDDPAHWSAVEFGRKFVEFRMIHNHVTRLMDAVYGRSTFLPQLPRLVDVARITGLEIGLDADLGSAQRIHFDVRQGKDDREAFGRMDFAPTYADGRPFTEADEDLHFERHGPNATWPRGVAWRRHDGAVIDGYAASFGAEAARIFRR